MSGKTYDALCSDAAGRLREAGIETPLREARWLLAHAAGVPAPDLLGKGGETVPEDTQTVFESLLRRRCAREPFQHIVGTTSFFGLELVCDSRALVPRPDSEIVVEQALALLPDGKNAVVADLGAGSGCLLAAILANRLHATGIGVEASPNAASLARENLRHLGLDDRAMVFEGSWADWPDWSGADLVISNPPYIARAEIETLMPEVRNHDPHAALDGGEDGLAAYREIVRLATERLKPGAWLVFEIGHDQRDPVIGLMQASGFTDTGMSQDLGGNDRAVWGKWPDL